MVPFDFWDSTAPNFPIYISYRWNYLWSIWSLFSDSKSDQTVSEEDKAANGLTGTKYLPLRLCSGDGLKVTQTLQLPDGNKTNPRLSSINIVWSHSIMNSVLVLGLGVPGLSPSPGKNFVLCNIPIRFRITMLNKKSPLIKLPFVVGAH